ncbi:elongation factor P maturation arginine rhamnosyltransferase EarP [Chitinibacter bivalviorum]|nr:elongation factor P maturation arginine rhamnosyltransferase EarP [Chitinibacter bivalviorum]
MPQWAIFCRVVDNFGDIGVCWRLARQLTQEFTFEVTLWVDDLVSFAKIRAEIDPTASTQSLEGVTVRHWAAHFSDDEVAADVVIEAFACDLPSSYIEKMKQRLSSPIWLNLEYLSAEEWVEGCHGLPSPVQGLNKYFFFPGFTAHTGGVLSEAQQRDARQGWSTANAQQFLTQLCPIGRQFCPNALTVSLFAYEPIELKPWLAGLIDGDQSVHLLVPQGRVLAEMDLANLSLRQCAEGVYQDGALTISIFPMLSQDRYDQLLWSCDLNFVRGEDSFIRAQLAGKPFIWHIYPQDDDAHRDKLDAFLLHYLADLPEETTSAVNQMMQVWNHGGDAGSAWQILLRHRAELDIHADVWRKKLLSHGDLATNLVRFVNSKVK